MIKAIATDLDGTLFYPRKKIRLISKPNKQFIRNAIKEGKEVILVTGRNYNIAEKVGKAINMNKSISAVSCNGAVILHQDELIKEECITGQEALDFMSKFDDNKDIKSWMFFTNKAVLLVDLSRVPLIVRIFGWLGFNLQGAYSEPHVIGKKKVLKILSNPDCRLYKIMPWFGFGKKNQEKARLAVEEWSNKYQEYSYCYSGAAVEVVKAGVNKASSLKELLKALGISEDEVAVAGDSGNDIPLFREFENSFVMNQAPDAVKNEAKTVIKSVAEMQNYIK